MKYTRMHKQRTERIANVALHHEHVDTNSGGERYNIDTASILYRYRGYRFQNTVTVQFGNISWGTSPRLMFGTNLSESKLVLRIIFMNESINQD